MSRAILLPNRRRAPQTGFGDAPAHVRAAREAGVLGVSDYERRQRDKQRMGAANRLAEVLQAALEPDAPPYAGLPITINDDTPETNNADDQLGVEQLNAHMADVSSLGELGIFTLIELTVEEPVPA